ncbi:hypothetical protein PHYPSEUDO_012868 [Phytophthora pseudosyringae]|uniref:PWWP domain-containing protein n=1 Tax=Phytophthora pseudosyringae TaxID=221518 RepID=A0A8T1V8P5_9STRA|nr:hypothetical protein PHYPSEUDO_012868 [Phytophthora pseudosyringae]
MSAESTPALHEGDWLDVMDGDGIWNVAQVLRLPSPETVEVTYDCWGNEYNEELRRDSERVAPFHTHTRAVKCWAKLDTWPWWPALLTVRAPGSASGSRNLRMEERLLVDFLDSAVFSERCRCWVKKSKVVAFQSDEETRKRLTKPKKKMKKRSKAETRSRNLKFSTNLLAKCDAREDFPEFVQGTLPVQFKKNFTRPTKEVRKEMGEEIWQRGLADNKINHAATHAYTPVFPAGSNSDSGNDAELSLSTEVKDARKTAARDDSHTQVDNRSVAITGTEDKTSAPKQSKSSKSCPTASEKSKLTTQKPKNYRKRTRPNNYDETSGSSDTSRAGKAKSPHYDTDQLQVADCVADKLVEEKETGNVSKSTTATKVVRVSPRKYGKTPKVLKTPRRPAANLPPYTPPHAQVLLGVKPRNEQHAHRSSRTSHTRQRAKKGNGLVRPFLMSSSTNGPTFWFGVRTVVANKELPATDLQVQHTSAAARRSVSSESKPDGGPASTMKNLARLTKATLRADAKLHEMEAALEGKLTELAEKFSKAEELRSRCAALQAPAQPPTAAPASETEGVNQEDSLGVRSSKSASASETRRVSKDSSRREHKPNGRPDASRVPTFARKSSQANCGIRGLELALDEIISKELNQGLSAAITPAELDTIKADLLNSREVQAAITRIQHPSYGWTASTEISSRETSSLSDGNSRRVWEKAKSRFTKYTSPTGSSERRPSPRSPSQQFGRSWGYGRDSETSADRFQSSSSLLLDSLPADQSGFGFSVNDNFSMNQWYRDLYPKAFGYQQP